MLLNNEYLMLGGSDNNVICAIYRGKFPNTKISFHRLDLQADFSGTPLEKFIKIGKLETSLYRSMHLGDLLRLIYLYKVSQKLLEIDVLNDNAYLFSTEAIIRIWIIYSSIRSKVGTFPTKSLKIFYFKPENQIRFNFMCQVLSSDSIR